MPTKYNEVVLVMDKNNQVSDYALYTLGLLDQKELKEILGKIMKGEEVPKKEVQSFDYDEIVGLKYKLLLKMDPPYSISFSAFSISSLRKAYAIGRAW